MALRILKADIDRLTAHITVQAQVEEHHSDGSTTLGAPETFGIDRGSLEEIHGSGAMTEASVHVALERWLAGMHDIALARKHTHDHATAAVSRLAKTTLQFSEGAR
jgi:hypothetical protein